MTFWSSCARTRPVACRWCIYSARICTPSTSIFNRNRVPSGAAAKESTEARLPSVGKQFEWRSENAARKTRESGIRAWHKRRSVFVALRKFEIHYNLSLNFHRFPVQEVGLVSPLADRIRGRSRQDRIPIQNLDGGDTAFFADGR